MAAVCLAGLALVSELRRRRADSRNRSPDNAGVEPAILQQRMEELRRQTDGEIEELRRQNDAQLQGLHEEHAAEVEAIAARGIDSLERIKDKHRTEILSLECQNALLKDRHRRAVLRWKEQLREVLDLHMQGGLDLDADLVKMLADLDREVSSPSVTPLSSPDRLELGGVYSGGGEKKFRPRLAVSHPQMVAKLLMAGAEASVANRKLAEREEDARFPAIKTPVKPRALRSLPLNAKASTDLLAPAPEAAPKAAAMRVEAVMAAGRDDTIVFTVDAKNAQKGRRPRGGGARGTSSTGGSKAGVGPPVVGVVAGSGQAAKRIPAAAGPRGIEVPSGSSSPLSPVSKVR